MVNPVVNPAIPYVGPIHGGRIVPGKMVKIQGVVPQDATRFNIHLQCGSKVAPRDDVAVRVTVRFREGCIAVNSLQNTVWGREQRDAMLPVNRGEKFKIILTCDTSQYLIAINGQHCYEFPQRINYSRVTHLAIDGDIIIHHIAYELPAENITAARATTSSKYDKLTDNAHMDKFDNDPLSDFDIGLPRRLSYEAAIYGSEGSYGYQEVSIIPSGPPSFPTVNNYSKPIKLNKLPSLTATPPNIATLTDSKAVAARARAASPVINGANTVYPVAPFEKTEKPISASLKAPKTVSKDAVAVPISEDLTPRPIKDTECQRCCSNFCGIIIGGAFILGFLLLCSAS